MDFVLASNNAHKLEEFRQVFSHFNINVYSLKDLGIDVDPEETGKTFKDNAFIKANEVAKYTDKVVIADDSGLEVEALDGFPGIYSARFLDGHSYEEKFVELNRMLGDKENRTCNFNCTLCVINLEKEPLFFEGKVFGTMLHEPVGEHGFGYDPIFYYEPFKTTLANVDPEMKNKVSHRGLAIQKFHDYLVTNKII